MGQLYVWYLGQLDDYNAVTDRMFELDNKRRGEQFTISSASVSQTDDLAVTVVNNGGSTIRIVSLWVIDESIPPNTHSQSDVNVFIPSGGAGVVSGSATYGSRLTLRLISELGSRVSYRIAPASEISDLRMNIDTSPPTVIGSHDVAITLLVFNNNTEYNSLYNLQIDPDTDIFCIYNFTSNCIDAGVASLTPPSMTTISSLRSGETAAFTWKYTTTSPEPGTTLTFKGHYTGASVNATETVGVVTPFGRDEDQAMYEVIGSLRIQISTFRWSQNDGGNWSAGFSVLANKDTVWRVNATNTYTKSIYLNDTSVISFLRTDSGSIEEFYIIEGPRTVPNNRVYPYDGDDDVLGYPDPVVIAPGQTVTLYFGADNPGSDGDQKTGSASNSWASFIVLIGTYNGDPNDPYGQSIPFIAVTTV